jgi:hypothetical protein
MIETKPGINIKNLIISEPTRDLVRYFNPKKDISREDLQHLDLNVGWFLGKVRNNSEFNWVDYDSDFLLRVGLLKPEILRNKINEKDWDLLKKSISGAGIMDESKAILTLKIINPEKFANDSKILKKFRNKYHFFQKPFGDVVGFNSTGYVKLVDEEGFGNLSVDYTGIDRYQKLISDWKKAKEWEHVGNILSNFKLIDSSLIPELPMSKDDWDNLWDYLYEEIEKNSANRAGSDHTKFLKAASVMAILSAEKFCFEDNKFQAIYKLEEQSDHVITKTPMPKRRRF